MSEPDLRLEPQFVPDHEARYLQLVYEIPWDERMRARKTANFGAAYNYSLAPGSLLYMPPRLQQDWKHAILTQEGASGRISLTFRLLAPAGET